MTRKKNESPTAQEKLSKELGGDHVASRAASIMIQEFDTDTLKKMKALHASMGALEFSWALEDARRCGPLTQKRIIEMVSGDH